MQQSLVHRILIMWKVNIVSIVLINSLEINVYMNINSRKVLVPPC